MDQKQDNQASQQSGLLLSDLAWWTSDQDIEEVCIQAGTKSDLLSTHMTFQENKINGKSKGVVYVPFLTLQAATLTKNWLEKKDIHGIRPTITLSHSNPFRIIPQDKESSTKDHPRSTPADKMNRPHPAMMTPMTMAHMGMMGMMMPMANMMLPGMDPYGRIYQRPHKRMATEAENEKKQREERGRSIKRFRDGSRERSRDKDRSSTDKPVQKSEEKLLEQLRGKAMEKLIKSEKPSSSLQDEKPATLPRPPSPKEEPKPSTKSPEPRSHPQMPTQMTLTLKPTLAGGIASADIYKDEFDLGFELIQEEHVTQPEPMVESKHSRTSSKDDEKTSRHRSSKRSSRNNSRSRSRDRNKSKERERRSSRRASRGRSRERSREREHRRHQSREDRHHRSHSRQRHRRSRSRDRDYRRSDKQYDDRDRSRRR